MATKSPQTIALDIEAEIVAAYIDSHRCVFWPGQFAQSGIGPQEVVSGMRVLEHCGKVHATASLMCPNGHHVWQGEPAKMRDYIESVHNCRYCDVAIDHDDVPVDIQYELTADWRQRLDRTCARGTTSKKAR